MKLKFVITGNTSPAALKIMADTLRSLASVDVEGAEPVVEPAPQTTERAEPAAQPAPEPEQAKRTRRTKAELAAAAAKAEPAAAAAQPEPAAAAAQPEPEPHPTEQVPAVAAAAAAIEPGAALPTVADLNKKAMAVAKKIGPENIKAKIAELGAKLIANLSPESLVEFDAWLDTQ